MKPEEQRIAIAKACGWAHFEPDTIQYTARRADGKWGEIPNYPNDLNAMHEAVESLRGKAGPEWFDFQRILMIECGSWMNCIQASATQRAEAFLKTLNLWRA